MTEPARPRRAARRRSLSTTALLVVLVLVGAACQPDFDGDGLPDDLEALLGSDPAVSDTDGDGLGDGFEHRVGLDPTIADPTGGPDADGDGASDSLEASLGTDWSVADSDSDGLTDGDEAYVHETHPLLTDSDSDGGVPDGDEVNTYGTDPLDVDSDDDGVTDGVELYQLATDPLDRDTDDDGIEDGAEDDDDDDLNLLAELALGTSPTDADTDGDGVQDGPEALVHGSDPLRQNSDDDDEYEGEQSWSLSDGDEVNTYGTDPTEIDSDGDGATDVREVLFLGWDPLDTDTDDDGLLDGDELARGTGGLDSDSDDDGFGDGFEVLWGLDPLTPLSFAGTDTDADGVPDSLEAIIGTDPADPDSDDDGADDDELFLLLTSPFDQDADGDLLLDGAEVVEGTGPTDQDTDDDRLPDGLEARGAGDPLVAEVDGGPDDDGDTLGATFEAALGTNAAVGDSDGDGVADGSEVDLAGDPLAADGDADTLADATEVTFGSRLGDADSDADRLSDGVEFALGFQPTSDDSDGDGIRDGDEDGDGDGGSNLDELGWGTVLSDADSDDDSYLDAFEQLNGFDPLVANGITTVVDTLSVSSVPTGGTPGTATIGEDGGTVVATGPDGVEYRLVIPYGAVTTPTTITVTPAAPSGTGPIADETVGAVDLAPSGLVLEVPATLVMHAPEAAPFDVGDPFAAISWNDDGTTEVREVGISGFGRTMSVEVSHFSGAATLKARSDAIHQLVLAGLKSVPSLQAQVPGLPALVLGLPATQGQIDTLLEGLFNTAVAPAVGQASQGVTELTVAVDVLAQWEALVALTNSEANFGRLETATTDLVDAAQTLNQRYQQPACTGPVTHPYDWVVYSLQLAAVVQVLGGNATAAPCVDLRLDLSVAPGDLTGVQFVTVQLHQYLAEPDGSPIRDEPGDFSFALDGGTVGGDYNPVIASDSTGRATVVIDRGSTTPLTDFLDVEIDGVATSWVASGLAVDETTEADFTLHEGTTPPSVGSAHLAYSEYHDFSIYNPPNSDLRFTSTQMGLDVAGTYDPATGDVTVRASAVGGYTEKQKGSYDTCLGLSGIFGSWTTNDVATLGYSTVVTYSLDQLLSGQQSTVSPGAIPRTVHCNVGSYTVPYDAGLSVGPVEVLGGGVYRLPVSFSGCCPKINVGIPSITLVLRPV